MRGGHVKSVVKSIPVHMDGIDEVEVLVIDDGSSDDTAEEAAEGGAKVIRHIQNKGLGCAFQTAMNYAAESGADIMVNMDGDGQFSAGDMDGIIAPIINGQADMVTASRFIEKKRKPDMPTIKYWGNVGMSMFVSHLCRKKYHDVSCGFRAYSRETILRSNFHGKYTYTQEAFIFYTSQNLKIVEVPVDVKYFPDRESRIAGNLFHYAQKTSGIILSLYRDYYPMRLFGNMAAFFLAAGVFFGGIFFWHFLTTGMFRGYLFAGLICAFSLLLALAFLCVGLCLQGNVRLRENQNRILHLLKKAGWHGAKMD